MDPYIGEIRIFGGDYAPDGWATCDGQALAISGNEALYSLLGTTYGGDGNTTFALPDLRGRLPIGWGQNPQTGTTYALGQIGGTETVPLTPAQLPAHIHAANCQSGTGTSPTPQNCVWAKMADATPSPGKPYTSSTANASMSATAISSAGGSQPHDNMMPFFVFNYIICLQGIYPSRP